MNDTARFEQFYSTSITSELPNLRLGAKRLDSWKLLGVLAGIGGVGFFLLSFTDIFGGEILVGPILLCISMLVVSIYQYASQKDKFTDDFKAAVINKIIAEVSPGLVYHPGKRITTGEFKMSGLYRYRRNGFEGDDLVEGVVDRVPFRCSELWVSLETGGKNGFHTVFRGLFLVAKIGDQFAGGTYLIPRDGVQLSAKYNQAHYRLPRIPSAVQIKFDDPDFDKHFKVLTTWSAQAQEILTTERRSQILKICGALKIPISISFVSGRCFIGVPVNQDLLEPGSEDPGDKEEIRKYFTTIELIPGLIRQLGLQELQ